MKKVLAILMAGAEGISIEFADKVASLNEAYSTVIVGVYTDNAFERIFRRKPLAPYEVREKYAKAVKGVQFVFPWDNAEENPEYSENVTVFEIDPYEID